MENLKAVLDYFSPGEWQAIGIAGIVFFWLLTRLTNWYFDRKARLRQRASSK